MKAIITKYLGPTDISGARIKAKAEGVPAVIIPYPHELSGEDVHKAAAVKLCDKYGWLNINGNELELVGGGLPDNSGYAFCLRFK